MPIMSISIAAMMNGMAAAGFFLEFGVRARILGEGLPYFFF
jgi:hypothetical protein